MTTTAIAPAVVPPRTIEPEELEDLPNAVAYELVDGRLVRRHMGAESSSVGAEIISLVRPFLRGKQLGHLFGSDASYQCFPDAPKKVRRADVSFVRRGRLPGEKPPKGNILLAPDLAVEVVSPRDLADEVEQKVAEYLAAGVRLVWVVYPNTRKVRIHRPPVAAAGAVTELSESDPITGEDVIPGFECRAGAFFETD